MRSLWVCIGVSMVLAALPTHASAQGRTCRQVLPSDARRIMQGGNEIIYYRDPVRVLCSGGLLLEADSAVMNRGTGSVELVGNVFYQDSVRELSADWANYIGGRSQLLTRGSTVLRDLEGGAVITGEQLNYLRATADRPQARMIITGGRPYAMIPPRRDTATSAALDRAPPETAEPAEPGVTPEPTDSATTEVWADRMELLGEDVFMAEGDVDIERVDLTGEGDFARFDQRAETMSLTGTAHVQTPDYRLDGDRIDAFLAGEQLREVHSEGSARVTADELNVRAERVRIGFTDGALERMEAWNPTGAEAPSRALARARDFLMRADSIDARADSLGVREIRAVGRAYGERQVADARPARPAATGTPGAQGAEVRPAPSDPELPAAASRDWIQGDTILGYFTRIETESAAESEVESATGSERADSVQTVLDRIVVVGSTGPALSLYRMRSDDPSERSSINFMKASRIILFMEQGDVARVEAEGPIEGLYLDPGGGQGEGP